jgi:hypothetical protein
MRFDNMKRLPLLKTVMRLKKVRVHAIAEKSGVSERTIVSARAGNPVDAYLADCLSEGVCK